MTLGSALILFAVVFVMRAWRDARYRRLRAMAALLAGALVAVCLIAAAFVLGLGMALGGMHTD